MWGICSPISLPIRGPDKAFGTWAEEEEVSGFTAGLFPVEHRPMWTGVICPPWTPVLSPHSPTESLPEGGTLLWGWLPVKVWPLRHWRESQLNKSLGLPMGAGVYNIYICSVCVFNTATQAFIPKVITSENLSPRCLLISLSFSGSEQEGMIGLHPNVCVCECVFGKWHALRCSANTQSKRWCCPAAHPAALVFTYRYLLSSPLFPL